MDQQEPKHSFNSTILDALTAMRQRGGVTARALPARFDLKGTPVPYRGSNVLLLALAGEGRKSSIWGTINALRSATGRIVRKGQTSAARVVFAGFKDAPVSDTVDPLLDAATVQAEKAAQGDADQDSRVPKGKIRIYRSIPAFNADQLDAVDLSGTLPQNPLPDDSFIVRGLEAALEARAREGDPEERPLSDRLANAVLTLGEVMVRWMHGREATFTADLFESTADLLVVSGVAQQCVDHLALPQGFYAYGVPQVAAATVDRSNAAIPEAPAASVAKPARPRKPEHGSKSRTQKEALDEFLGLDLGW